MSVTMSKRREKGKGVREKGERKKNQSAAIQTLYHPADLGIN